MIWSSETASEVGPSIEMPLSSNRTIRRPRPQMAGQRGGLVADALHQAAVAGDDVGVVVDQLVAEAGGEMALGQRHADRVGEALAQRPGRGLDAEGVPVLGMAGRARAELAEAPQLVERHVRIAGEVEQRIEQHRAVAGREHEPVAVGPIRMLRVDTSETASTAPWRRRPCPWACRDGRTSPARPRPWRVRGWRWRGRRG